eukprot:TRINITY_DN42025_c0_g1_i1.p1 TRINITY_DN42025_c0_g1~~TRINITY_DN42025_c0_g1_i1.p1  ORF type:complete len:780 (-),score=107.70 TRINITY_DN42025_c0_g1_i1:845-3103(-)
MDDWADSGATVFRENAMSLSIDVAPEVDVGCRGGERNVAVRVRVPDAALDGRNFARRPVDVCCVIDVSGSMSDRASFQDKIGNPYEDTNLSCLDVVIHAVKTVLHILEPNDRLAVVSFNNTARLVFPLASVTDDSRAEAIAVLEALRPSGLTNLWAGVFAGLEALRCAEDCDGPARQRAVMLLTDGLPNISPPQGHLFELGVYKENYPGFSFQLNTFGFGYSQDSSLLLDLAVEGHGTFAFIPDAVIVGTCFVNSIANVLSTLTQSATLHLATLGEARFAGPILGVGESTVSETSWGRVVSLGPLSFGQSRDIVVAMQIPGQKPYLEAVVVYPLDGGPSRSQHRVGRALVQARRRRAAPWAVAAVARSDTICTGYAAIAAGEVHALDARLQVVSLHRRVEEFERRSCHEIIPALKSDVAGRMAKALDGQERFNRWGRHYLRALTRAHQLQLCTNFMDPGLQVYGGHLFRDIRKVGDEIFLRLPPPKPKTDWPYSARFTGATCPVTPPATRQTMDTYYAGSGGGCFSWDSTVDVFSGTPTAEVEHRTKVSDVHPGDKVRVADGHARVICVVKIEVVESTRSLVVLPTGLRITPRHPVRVEGIWRRPADLDAASLTVAVGTDTDVVEATPVCLYNFVLDRCHVLVVNGVECVTWGHGLDGSIVSHEFYGTGRVLTALSRLHGWDRGYVEVIGRVRDATSGRVVGFLGVDDGDVDVRRGPTTACDEAEGILPAFGSGVNGVCSRPPMARFACASG